MAHALRAVIPFTPAPVTTLVTALAHRTGAVASRRRKLLAVPIILALHAALLAALAIRPPPAPPDSLAFIDVTLIGEGEKSAIDYAPAPPASGTAPDADAEDESAPPPSEAPAPTEAEADDAGAGAAEPETASEPKPPPEPTPTADAPADAPPEAADSSTDSADVLALVQQITGADASTMDESATPPAVLTDEQIALLRARSAEAGGGCAMDEALRLALTADAGAQAALAAVPAQDRSVSNAIQLWDGEWTHAREADGVDPLAAVRAVTISTVDAAPARCRNVLIRGPRFFVVTVADTQEMVIVMGSGEWRWREILPQRRPALVRWLGF